MKAMYRAALMVAAFVFLLPLSARSEIKAGSFEVGPFGGYNFFENGQNLKDRPVFGGRLGYNFTRHFGIEGVGEYIIHSRVDDKAKTGGKEGQYRSPMDDVDLTFYHLDLVYHFIPDGNFNPFVLAGFGGAHSSPKISTNGDMAAFNVGVGAKYWVTDNIAFRVDVQDYMVTEIIQDTYHNIRATIGITFAFGGESAQAASRRPAETAAAVAAADTTAPTVVCTNPDSGATDVAIDRNITATFSEAMDRSTITAATFTLEQGATPVSGEVTSAASVATFTPATKLSIGTRYTATITTGANDLAGNALASNYVWSFTTGMAADTVAQTVIFTSPVNGATAAPVNQKVHAAFSEAMDPATITAATFTLEQGATPVSGEVTSAASVATFTPASDFEKGKAYTATITTGAEDLAGNALASDYVWNFTALAAPKVVPAVLITLEDSHFLFDSSALTENGKTILNYNARILKENPKMKIRIAGYTSASGTAEYNQKLSERRATAVKNYLVKEGGIAEDRLTKIGYGATRPAEYEAVPSDIYSDAAHANMRVLFEIIVQ